MADNSNAIVFEQMLNTFYNNSVNLGLSERQNRIIAACMEQDAGGIAICVSIKNALAGSTGL